MEKNKRKYFVLCVLVGGMLAFGGLLSIQAATPPAGAVFWIVTENDTNMAKRSHEFYSEYTELPFKMNLTEEWYVFASQGSVYGPVTTYDYWVDTSVSCWTESVGGDALLYVEIYAESGSYTYIKEYINWTRISGDDPDIGDQGFTVKPIWYDDQNQRHEETMEVYFEGEGNDEDDVNLGDIQWLWLELTAPYKQESIGQKEYWVETEYPEKTGKTETEMAWSAMYSSTVTKEDINQTWWTDDDYSDIGKEGEDRMIEEEDWHICTKVEAWAVTSGNSARLFVRTYGQSNYYPETINWTILNGGNKGSDVYFTIEVYTPDVPHSWTSDDIYLDGDDHYQNIGSLDNLTMSLTYTDP